VNFIPLASSSKGNSYLVTADGVAPLLIEAGIPVKQLREKLREHGVSITDLAGCLVSHEHGDHSKAVKDLLKSGVDCWTSRGTAEAIDPVDAAPEFLHYRIRILHQYFTEDITGWTVKPFPLIHDAAEPLGFFIERGREDALLFVPDTGYVKNRFSGVTIAAIECNFQEEILSGNILKGNLPPVVGHRTRRNHMSLHTLIEMLKANDLSKCREIWLLHLSDGNSDERRMIREVQEATGIPTRAA
jgi:phosphoribosyl 1,2-cyclic phosphodiesterase